MDEVFPNIFIGNWLDGQRAAKSGEYFTINVTEEIENPYANIQHKLCRQYAATDPIIIPVSELNLLASNILGALQSNMQVCIHCTAGIERSPLVVVWFLHTYYNMSLDAAYEIIRKARPEILDRRGWIQYESPEQFLQENK